MKKEYIKPEMLLESIQVMQMIATSPGIGDGEYDPSKPIQGNGRRGTWGNLWDDED